jgi:molybdate transport system regulatory protein
MPFADNARRFPCLVDNGSAEVRFRLRITKGRDIAVGPGKIDLLEAIANTGSIAAAAKALGMSYRRAWLLVDTMNRCFEEAVVTAETGGSRGGGARITPLGEEVVRRYRRAEASAHKAAAIDLRALKRMLASRSS